MSAAAPPQAEESREQQLARILLVEACEESDPGGRFLSRRERERATSEARRAAGGRGGGERALEDEVRVRAELLSDRLERQHPALARARRGASWRIPGRWVLVAALLIGLGGDALGHERRVNLLAFPLLGLILWNLVVYVLLLGEPLAVFHGPARWLASALGRIGSRLARTRLHAAAPEQGRWLATSLARFATLWTQETSPLLLARARRLLHLGAFGLALGVLLGMYVRGLVFEYRASWESTFLEPAQVHALLSLVLGSAADLVDSLWSQLQPSARELLSEPMIAALRAPAGDGPAALWIHLWALTTAGVILVPRAILAAAADHRARQLEQTLGPRLEAPYYLRLMARERGETVRVEVLPYSHRLSDEASEALRELLLDLFGGLATIQIASPLPYGVELPEPAPGSPGAPGQPTHRVVIFNLAQAPEEEVHGRFLETLKERCSAGPRRAGLLVLVDEEPYRRRHEYPGAPDRIEQRRRSWERVARACDLALVPLRPEDLGGEGLSAARSAIWPAAMGATG
jgi:hypothetical protein